MRNERTAKNQDAIMMIRIAMTLAIILISVMSISTAALSTEMTDDQTPSAFIADDLPPEVIGVKDIILYLGDTYDFGQDIIVSDNEDENPLLEIDSSGVDFNNTGVYEVVYKASDRSNNTRIQTATVTINPRPAPSPENKKIIYLTFDDGPSPYTLELLEILRSYDVKATFFVTGYYNLDNIFLDIVNDGHAIGLHTNSHDYASIYASEDAFFADLAAIEKRIDNVIGVKPKILRFAGGSSNAVSKTYNVGIMSRLSSEVHKRGYKYYDWSHSVADSDPNVTAEQEIDNVSRCTSDVICLLAHDTKPQTIEAMRTIVPMMLERGYQFRTINEDTPEIHHKINN